jgi:DNA-binding response OmpR family regulator
MLHHHDVTTDAVSSEDPTVSLLWWPADEAVRQRLALARRPRLLLVAAGDDPPVVVDELEDWIRFPLHLQDLAIRTRVLAHRARDVPPRPVGLVLDEDGVLHNEDRWVPLSTLEARACSYLLARSGQQVTREELTCAVWPTRAPADPRAVGGVISRLRRRVAPLGVGIHTLGRVGVMIDHAPSAPALPDGRR